MLPPGEEGLERFRTRDNFDQFFSNLCLTLAVIAQCQFIDHFASIAGRIVHRGHFGTHFASSIFQQGSENLNERYETLTAQVSYGWREPIGPLQLSVAAGVATSHFRDYTIILPVPDGRRDTRVFGSVTAVFPTVDYAGFVPVVTLGVQDTRSNVSRFERNEYSLNVGIRSSF